MAFGNQGAGQLLGFIARGAVNNAGLAFARGHKSQHLLARLVFGLKGEA